MKLVKLLFLLKVFCYFWFCCVEAIFTRDELTTKPPYVKTWRRIALQPHQLNNEVIMHHNYSKVWIHNPQISQSSSLDVTQIQDDKTNNSRNFRILVDNSAASRNEPEQDKFTTVNNKLENVNKKVEINDKLESIDNFEQKTENKSYDADFEVSHLSPVEQEINYPSKPEEVYQFRSEVKQFSNMAFEQCPPDVTAQLVYQWSCSQYLNCWKGRGYIQNCAAGTLFNPESLECDYPHKVHCISGPHSQKVRSEKLITFNQFQNVQCQPNFSGLAPHPQDCTKFLNCFNGQTFIQDCGPGTAFNAKIQACDYADNAECYQSHSNLELETTTTYPYDIDIRMDEKNIKETYKQFQRGQEEYSFNPTTYSQTRTSYLDQNLWRESNNKQKKINVDGRLNFNTPENQDRVSQQPGRWITHGTREYVQTQYEAQSQIPEQERKNQNCTINCYFQSNPNIPIYQGKINHNQDQIYENNYKHPPNAQGNHFNTETGTSTYTRTETHENKRQNSVKCPPGHNGLVPHPFICEKFLNCANGLTFIQDCGPGTVFNPSLKVCDWPYNVNCQTLSTVASDINYKGSNYESKPLQSNPGYNTHVSGFQENTRHVHGRHPHAHSGYQDQNFGHHPGYNRHNGFGYGQNTNRGTYYTQFHNQKGYNAASNFAHTTTNHQTNYHNQNGYFSKNDNTNTHSNPNYNRQQPSYPTDQSKQFYNGHKTINEQRTQFQGTKCDKKTRDYQHNFPPYQPGQPNSPDCISDSTNYEQSSDQYPISESSLPPHFTSESSTRYENHQIPLNSKNIQENDYGIQTSKPCLQVQATIDQNCNEKNINTGKGQTSSQGFSNQNQREYSSQYPTFSSSTNRNSFEQQQINNNGSNNGTNKNYVRVIGWRHNTPPNPINLSTSFTVHQVKNKKGDHAEANIISGKSGHLCAEGEFKCSHTCIPQKWVCDGNTDCINGADEKNCTVKLDSFTLHKNSRLYRHEIEKWLNTNLQTCAQYCLNSKTFQCKSFNFRKEDNVCYLSNTNIGLSGSLATTSLYDYYEMKHFSVNCSHMYECPNKKCINFTQLCDGIDDCGNRKDEKNCDAKLLDYEIKLAGSERKNEGRIELKVFNEWGFICDDQFTLRDADVACRELGFSKGALEVKPGSYFAKDVKDNDTFYLMDDVSCFGNETSMRNCDFSGWGIHNCMPQEIVGVICQTDVEVCPEDHWKCDTTPECLQLQYVCDGIIDCADRSDEGMQHCEAPIELRLVNGTTKAEGRVEVRYHGIWGTICDDDFNDHTAKVICQSLGYHGSAVAKKDGAFGAGQGPIWLDQVNCFGNESLLQDCSHWNWGEHNCEHDEDAGVVCSNLDTSSFEKKSKDQDSVQIDAIHFNKTDSLTSLKCGYRGEDLFLEENGENDLHFRVVKGSIARRGDYPWQATIRVKGKSKSSHWCGAVILSNQYVLTAAHCLVGFAKGSYIVRAGDYNVDEKEGTEVEAYIEDFYVHKKFRQGGHMNNDIALIRLKGTGLQLSKQVQPICLPEKETHYRHGMNCTISGFGSIESGVSTSSRVLRAGWVNIQSDLVCKMPNVYGNAITEGMFCAGSLDEGVDSCDGDSGGPLACLDKGLFTLYGITSWGQRCGHVNKPGVYVKISHYKDWIEKKIQEAM